MTNRTWTGHVFIGVSLDGYIARPNGDFDWLADPRPGPQHAVVTSSRPARGYDDFFALIDHLVIGRGTYEMVRSFETWPYAGKPVTVLSTTLATDDDRNHDDRNHDDRIRVARDLDEAVDQLARDGAEHVYVDGGQVIQAFLRADLIDELDITWAPVLIGTGLRLFGDVDHDIQMSLIATHAGGDGGDGMVHASYRVYRG